VLVGVLVFLSLALVGVVVYWCAHPEAMPHPTPGHHHLLP
jgi:hypothetical protein